MFSRLADIVRDVVGSIAVLLLLVSILFLWENQARFEMKFRRGRKTSQNLLC